ncbi:hypothetical protein [Actinocorallia populi]|uniref:hypothetical protein n=1 Tax=Actinocorallia populi TaxID=2079200 RepID=UPI0018E4F6CD|nr:hypothetical protein [Actinocorallia populi]
MSTSRRTVRIEWIPGGDRLNGTCHCGARFVGEEPEEMWNRLWAHEAEHPRPKEGM